MDATHNFERMYLYCIENRDYARLDSLIVSADALSHSVSQLSGWVTLAEAFLARRRENDPRKAISMSSDLLQQTELSERLQARVWNVLTASYGELQQWDDFAHAAHRALVLYAATGNTLGEAGIHLTLSNFYARFHYSDWVHHHNEAALDLLNTLEDTRIKRQYHAGVLIAAGLQAVAERSYDSAESSLTQARQMFTLLGDDWGVAITNSNLGDVFFAHADYVKAERHFREAFDGLQKVGDRMRQSMILYEVGTALLAQDRLHDAHLVFDQALQLAQEYGNVADQINIYMAYSELHAKNEDPDCAVEMLKRAIAVTESVRATIQKPDDRIRFMKTRLLPYEKLLEWHLQNGNYPSAYETLGMMKGRVQTETFDSESDDTPVQVPPAFQQREEHLRSKLAEAPSPAVERELALLYEQIRALNMRQRLVNTTQPMSLMEVQGALPENSLLLDFFSIQNRYGVWMITPDTVQVIQLDLTEAQLAMAFQSSSIHEPRILYGTGRDSTGKPQATWMLNTLFDKLLGSCVGLIESAETVYIIPHGLLHYLPFHALRSEPFTVPFVYAPNATILLTHCRRRPQSRHNMLAVGFNGSTLSHAEAEAASVALLPESETLVGKRASVDQFLQMATDYNMVHVSCHGRFNPFSPEQSAVYLADRPLTIREVAHNLRLNAELITLSACETGWSHILSGDELVGMSHALLRSGASAVMLSLWRVDEIATRWLMERFYSLLYNEQIRNQESLCRALYQAQMDTRNLHIDDLRGWLSAHTESPDSLAVINDRFHGNSFSTNPFAHPYFWAGFILVGGLRSNEAMRTL